MSALTLPPVIEAYFEAEQLDPPSVVRLFSASAIVKDERHTYHGTKEIRRWRAEAASKYTYTCQPLEVMQEGNRYLVNCLLEGSFPGSPVELGFRFAIDNHQITSLEIQ